MPITTSVITGTVAHKHSATGGSSDGGKLATGGLGGDTSFDLANGSLLFSNGTSLNELVIGGSGTVLTESAGVPTWASGGGGSAVYELVNLVETTGDVDLMTSTFAAINMADISKLVVVFNGSCNSSTATIKLTVNGLGSNYNTQTLTISGGSVSGGGGTGNSNFEVKAANGSRFQGVANLTTGNTTGTSGQQTIMIDSSVVESTGYKILTGENTTSSQTSFTEIELETANSPSNRFVAGCSLAVYRVNNT